MNTAAKILLVDDEIHIRRLVDAALSRAGFQVIEAGSARDALASLSHKPDLVLLDLGLPDRDGLELLPVMLKQSQAAIIVISAREATDQKVAALDLGATDYVTKPFDTEELLARVRAALRDRLTAQGGRSRIEIGPLTIDLVNHRITRAGESIHLTPKEFEALAMLARFPGRVITHQQLLGALWPRDYDRHIEYLRVVIRNIRQKLEVDPARPTLIVNELGVGYRLMGMDDTVP